MAAYIIVDIDISDPTGYEEYKDLALASVQAYNGRYLVRGGAVEPLEGPWMPKRLVILEFPSLEQAKAWYNSKEYEEARIVRNRTAVADIVLVEGVSKS